MSSRKRSERFFLSLLFNGKQNINYGFNNIIEFNSVLGRVGIYFISFDVSEAIWVWEQFNPDLFINYAGIRYENKFLTGNGCDLLYTMWCQRCRFPKWRERS